MLENALHRYSIRKRTTAIVKQSHLCKFDLCSDMIYQVSLNELHDKLTLSVDRGSKISKTQESLDLNALRHLLSGFHRITFQLLLLTISNGANDADRTVQVSEKAPTFQKARKALIESSSRLSRKSQLLTASHIAKWMLLVQIVNVCGFHHLLHSRHISVMFRTAWSECVRDVG